MSHAGPGNSRKERYVTYGAPYHNASLDTSQLDIVAQLRKRVMAMKIFPISIRPGFALVVLTLLVLVSAVLLAGHAALVGQSTIHLLAGGGMPSSHYLLASGGLPSSH